MSTSAGGGLSAQAASAHIISAAPNSDTRVRYPVFGLCITAPSIVANAAPVPPASRATSRAALLRCLVPRALLQRFHDLLALRGFLRACVACPPARWQVQRAGRWFSRLVQPAATAR